MKEFRLDKRRILGGRNEFNEIFSSGRRVSSKHFLLLTKNAEDSKFAFTVSRKIRGAVRRNFAKRRLREIVRLNQERLPEKIHIILQAKPGFERTNFELLSGEFVVLLKKIKSINWRWSISV